MSNINNVLWAQQLGGTFPDTGISIAADGSGNTYVTGAFNGTATFGNTTLTSTSFGYSDVFVAKLDSNKNVLWAQKLGGTLTDFGLGISVDEAGNIYATGSFSGTATFGSTTLTSAGNEDGFITKLDSNGNVLWAQKLGSTSSGSGIGITTDAIGNIYATGALNANLDINNSTSLSTSDTFIRKLDRNGNILWTKNLGGISPDSGFGITNDKDGNTYVSGFFSGTATFDNITLTSVGNNDAFITKLDSSGNFLWAKNLGGTSDDSGRGIIVDETGNAYFTGYFSDNATFGTTTFSSAGNTDVFVTKLDNNGNTVWAKNLGGTESDEGYGIVADEVGNIYVSGIFSGTATFASTTLTSACDSDAFIAKLDSNGNVLSAQKFGGVSTDLGTGIATDGKGNIYGMGGFSDTATFGNITLTSAGSIDAFVVKLGDEVEEPKITLALTPNSVAEDGGNNLIYTFTRDGDTTNPLTVNFNIGGNATYNTDYTIVGTDTFTGINGTVAFKAGDTTATVTINPTADTTFEADETVSLTLASGTGYAIATSEAVTGEITNGGNIITSLNAGSITINGGNLILTSRDTVEQPKISLVLTPNSVAEDGSNNLIYTFTRNGDTTNSQIVNFNIGGNATYNTDYTIVGTDTFTGINGTVAFKAGDTTATVTINPTADTTFEADETVSLTLASGTGYTIATSEAVTGEITNDDTQITLTPDNADSVFNLDGAATPVQFLLKSASPSVVNEIGLFTVDDDKGTIDGIAPNDSNYTQAALARSRSIFSTLRNSPNGFDSNLTRTLDLDGGIRFRLLLVQNGTLDGLRNGTVPLSQLRLSSPTSLQVSDAGNSNFDLRFEDSPGSGQFNDAVVQMQLGTQADKPIGTALQDQQEGEVLDLRGLTDTQNATFTINREAAYNNFVGFFRVADATGGIDTNDDGIGDLLPGQAGYGETAVKNRVGGINLSVGNQGKATFTGQFEAGSIFAPFLIVDGTPEQILDSNPNNNPAIYFPYLGANSDKVDHVRILGNNVFGFEDLSNGGDRDFNDIIVSVKFG
ncbi:hypothetical protein FACHB389_29560 [Nostoc calcicola FACHB-389]|nr:SBBP repeat-containing protein [Nostoc calcicola FACHB-3891]OKH25311.1 hypothetical protein FACHB389_29560 [Nostoc calcicola FACHB-389]